MADVFVSYAREDRARIAALVQALEAHGLSVFWDRQIPPGKTWREHIGQALADARCVVVAWSRNSIASEFVAEEADDARRRGVLVPVRIDAVLPPLGFRSVQAADLADLGVAAQPGDLASVLHAVDAVLGRAAIAAAAAAAAAAAGPPPVSPHAIAASATAPRARRWIVVAALALAASIAVAFWLAGRSGPTMVAPRSGDPAAQTQGRSLPPGTGVRIVDAWRGDDGSVHLRVQVQHRGQEPITVDAARVFALVTQAREPLPPIESRPMFETLQPREPTTFELHFAADPNPLALSVRLPDSGATELRLPQLR